MVSALRRKDNRSFLLHQTFTVLFEGALVQPCRVAMVTSIPCDRMHISVVKAPVATKLAQELAHDGMKRFLVESIGMRPQERNSSTSWLGCRKYVLFNGQSLDVVAVSGRTNGYKVGLGRN